VAFAPGSQLTRPLFGGLRTADRIMRLQSLPDARYANLGHVVAPANQPGSNGLSNYALLLGIELDRHCAQKPRAFTLR
jgi:hypothetical protein